MEHLERRQLLGMLSAAAIYVCIGCKKNTDISLRDAPGWTKSSETEEFTPDNLWQHLDGEAQQYIDAGLISLATCEYKYDQRLRAVVDVFTMRDVEAARRTFLAKKANGAQDVQIGDAGIKYEHSILFYKGKYIVRLFTYESGTDALPPLLQLAHDIEAQL